MNYIINPSWFYWINILDTLKVVLLIVAILGTVACIIGLPLYWWDEVYDDEDKKRFKKTATRLIVSLVIGWLIFIFLPSKTMLIEMQVARMATHENVSWTVDQIRSIVDYIVEAGKALK